MGPDVRSRVGVTGSPGHCPTCLLQHARRWPIAEEWRGHEGNEEWTTPPLPQIECHCECARPRHLSCPKGLLRRGAKSPASRMRRRVTLSIAHKTDGTELQLRNLLGRTQRSRSEQSPCSIKMTGEGNIDKAIQGHALGHRGFSNSLPDGVFRDFGHIFGGF